MDVSVIVVSWNTKDLLFDCIKSIYDNAGNVTFEIIVVDNASSDGSVECVKSRFPDVRIIVNEQNRGYAVACNQGIRVSQGEYILLLNSDIVICEGAIERTFRYAQQHPRTAVVGCQVLDDLGATRMTCFRFPDLTNFALRAMGLSRLFRNHRFFGRESMYWWKRDTEQKVDVVSGMFMFVRREAIDEVGLMDEDFFFYDEDVDWCYRFSHAGWDNVFWPGARVIHVHGGGQSSGKVRLQSFVQQQKSILLFFSKHRGRLICVLVRLILFVLFAVRGIGWTIVTFLHGPKNPSHNVFLANRRMAWGGVKYCLLGLGQKGKW